VSVEVCEGCGRAAGEREVWCPACGRGLPGRAVPEESEAAPPGWLVASTPRQQAGPWFEPLPSLPVVSAQSPAGGPGVMPYAARAEAGRGRAGGAVVPLPPPLPLGGAAAVADAGAAGSLLAGAPPLRALLLPLLVVALGSSAAALVLLVLHLLRDR
jgi:hypothetical protein